MCNSEQTGLNLVVPYTTCFHYYPH